MSFNVVRLKGDRHWWGVDLSDNTLCRRTEDLNGGRLVVVARFENTQEAVRFEEFLNRVADAPKARPTKWYEGWGFG